MASLPKRYGGQVLHRDLSLLPRMDYGLLTGGGTDILIVSPQSHDFEGTARKGEKKERGGIRLGRRARESDEEAEDGA